MDLVTAIDNQKEKKNSEKQTNKKLQLIVDLKFENIL